MQKWAYSLKLLLADILYKVAETKDFFCLSRHINPNAPGHTLCVPKRGQLFDLDEKSYMGLMQFSRQVALCLQEEVACKRGRMSVIGLEVPHVHVHLIPLRDMEDMVLVIKYH
jgi:histidine triad (HIT) family protein